MSQFKVGDKVVSKKTIDELELIKNETYFISGQIGNLYYFQRKNNKVLYGKNIIIPVAISESNLLNYFYTDKEVRKLKLNEINENTL